MECTRIFCDGVEVSGVWANYSIEEGWVDCFIVGFFTDGSVANLKDAYGYPILTRQLGKITTTETQCHDTTPG